MSKAVLKTNLRSQDMKFMLIVIPKGYEKAPPGTEGDPKHMEEMMKYVESLQKAGILLDLNGLHPPATAALITFSKKKPMVTDGPFTEAKETIGGYWIIQVKSREEAIQWASRAPMNDNEVIEVRQVQEMC
jgi:hypothetical protein